MVFSGPLTVQSSRFTVCGSTGFPAARLYVANGFFLPAEGTIPARGRAGIPAEPPPVPPARPGCAEPGARLHAVWRHREPLTGRIR